MSPSTPGSVLPRQRPPVDPRMRRRWVEARRADGRRRLRAASAVGVVVALGVGALAALESPLLSVAHVRLSGAQHESLAQVSAAAGLTSHRHMISVDAVAAAGQIERLPWVAKATVSRQWPDTVAVRVVERVVVAEVAAASSSAQPGAGDPGMTSAGAALGATQLGLVDATGRVLSWVSAPVPGLPTLVGVGTAGRPGTWLAGASSGPGHTAVGTVQSSSSGSVSPGLRSRTAALLALAALLPAPLAGEVRQLDDTGGVLTALVGAAGAAIGMAPSPGVEVIFGDTSRLLDKVAALQTVLSQVDVAQVTRIDLRVPGRPALTGSPQPDKVSSTAGG